MLILLSPAKSLDFETPALTKKGEVPRFLDEQTTELARVLRKKKTADLADLMSLSEGLARLNYKRYQGFDPVLIHQQAGKPKGSVKDGTPPPAKQALWAFTGDVYQGLNGAFQLLPSHSLRCPI